VLEKKFERAIQTFAASLPPFGVSFCCLMGRVLSPYGTSFAALWHLFCLLMLNFEAQYKSMLHFSRGGCKSLAMDSLLLSKALI